MTTATQEASAGQGAVQIKFVTRSGGNDFTGSGYHYYRSDKLNANTWFNNRGGVAKTPLKQNQIGGRAGGPIVIPGLFDGRNKAFFFFNYEEFRQPGAVSRDRNILNPLAQQGIFTYIPTGGSPQQVNLLALAAQNGQTATPDPIVANLLRDIRSAVTGGSIQRLDDNLERFRFNNDFESVIRYPTTRIDYNITEKHRFSNAFNYQQFSTNPDTLNNRDPRFPGFPATASQTSKRYGISNSLRSTITSNSILGYRSRKATNIGSSRRCTMSSGAVTRILPERLRSPPAKRRSAASTSFSIASAAASATSPTAVRA